MNSTEPNSDDLTAIAADIVAASNSDTSPQSPQNLGTFLDRLYGTLFLPKVTFEKLKAHPSFVQAAIIIALVNILETLRLNQLSILGVIWSVISGVIGWLFFTFLLKQLAGVFQKM